jgi:hypothetical protein
LTGASLPAGRQGHQLDGLVEIPCFEYHEAAQLFFCFGKRPVGDGHLAVSVSKGGRTPGTLKRIPANKVTILLQHVVVGETHVNEFVSLAFGHGVPFFLVNVSKANVFHDSLLFAL